jgi:nuclease S1
MKAQSAWGRSLLAGVWLLAWCLPMHAWAWGAQGHQVIAILAKAQLNAKASAEVARLLALEPGATLESVSTWADEHRNPASAPWHYVNFPRGSCTFNAQRDCPDGKCVVTAIERQLAILGGHGSDDQRLHALKYLVHLVGDVHQPLHAGYRDDKGGNTYQLRAFMRGSNLHAVWDSGLIRQLDEDTADMAVRLRKLVLPDAAKSQSPVQAAEESCRLVATEGFYPAGLVDQRYIQRFTPLMEQRLATAGARLAALLNTVLR